MDLMSSVLRKLYAIIIGLVITGLVAIGGQAADITTFEGLDAYGLPLGMLASAVIVFFTRESVSRLEALLERTKRAKEN